MYDSTTQDDWRKQIKAMIETTGLQISDEEIEALVELQIKAHTPVDPEKVKDIRRMVSKITPDILFTQLDD